MGGGNSKIVQKSARKSKKKLENSVFAVYGSFDGNFVL